MLSQIVVRPVCNAPQLAPAEGEQEFNVRGCFGIEGQLLLFMVADAHFVLFHAKALKPVDTELFPVGKPLKVRIRLAEELQLHLLKFPGTEGKVSGSNLIAEGFTHLADSERNLLSGGSLYILKVYKNTLRGLRTQIHRVLRVLCNALEGLEHQIELTDIRKIMFAAGRTGNIMLRNKCFHLFLAPAVDGAVQLKPVFRRIVLNQLVRTETLMAFLTIHQRVGKTAQMP